MKKGNNISSLSGFIKYVGIIFIMSASLVSSCGMKERVPEDDLFAMLKEIHFTTGLLNFQDIRIEYSAKDSIEIYTDIFEKYGYSRDEVESTLNYYFINKSKRLKKFYDSYIGELTQLEASFAQKSIKEQEATIRRTQTSYRYPELTGEGSIVQNRIDSTDVGSNDFLEKQKQQRGYFERQLLSPGTYTLSFTVTVDPSDQTIAPYMSLYIKPLEESHQRVESRKIASIRYVKDGNDYNFNVPVTKSGNDVLLLYGNLFDTQGDPSIITKNAYIRNINLDYVP